MRILIDGYNLMHASGLMPARLGPGGLEKARRTLLGLLAGSLGQSARTATVVFDAQARSDQVTDEQAVAAAHGIRVEFASGEGGADACIELLIRQDSAPKQLTVVSSDSRLRRAAERRGAHAVDSETFWAGLMARRQHRPLPTASCPRDKPEPASHTESDFWIEQFERHIDEQDLRELAGPFPDESQQQNSPSQRLDDRPLSDG
jgi:hypothetical protein